MRFSIPKRPNPRDVMIYQDVVCEGMLQGTAARMHGLSQSQVSRVCRKMKDYLVLSRPLEEQLSPAQAEWLTQQQYVEQLAFAQRRAISAFDHGIEYGPETSVTKCGPSGDSHGETKIRRPGQADPRLLKIYIDVAEKLRDARLDEGKAARAMEQHLKADPLWTEDAAVTRVIRTINDLRHTVTRMRRGGFVGVPLPEYKKHEVITHVRKGIRANRYAQPKTLLPDEWKAVLRAVECDVAPLEKLSPPDPLPRSPYGYAYEWEDFALESPDDYVPEERINISDYTGYDEDSTPIPAFPEGEKNMHNPGDCPPPEPLARGA